MKLAINCLKQQQTLLFLLFSVLVTMLLASAGDPTVKNTAKSVAMGQLLFIGSCFFYEKLQLSVRAFFSKPLYYYVLVFAAVAIACSVFWMLATGGLSADEARSALYRVVFLLVNALFLFYVAALVAQRPNAPEYVLALMMALLCYMALFIAACYGLGAIELEQNYHTKAYYVRNPPFSENIRNLGWMISAVFVTALAFALTPQTNLLKRMPIAGVLCLKVLFVSVAVALLLWSAGRNAIFWAAVLLVLLLACKLRQRFALKHKVAALMAVGVLLVAVAAVFPSTQQGKFWLQKMHQTKTSLENLGNENQSLTSIAFSPGLLGSRSMWRETFKAFLEAKWLGKGPQAYIRIDKDLYGSQPHSFILQFLLEWGLLGAVPVLFLIAVFCFTIVRTIFTDFTFVPVASGSIFLILTGNALLSGPYYHSQGTFFIVLSAGLFLGFRQSKRPGLAKAL